LYQQETLAVAEHCTQLDYRVCFQDNKVRFKTSGHMERLVKEATEIRLQLNKVNREEGFRLSQAWDLTIRILNLDGVAHRQAENQSPG
jgi:hypothetical protein